MATSNVLNTADGQTLPPPHPSLPPSTLWQQAGIRDAVSIWKPFCLLYGFAELKVASSLRLLHFCYCWKFWGVNAVPPPPPPPPSSICRLGPKAWVKCLVWALFLFYFPMLTIGLELWPMATVYTLALHGFCFSSNSRTLRSQFQLYNNHFRLAALTSSYICLSIIKSLKTDDLLLSRLGRRHVASSRQLRLIKLLIMLNLISGLVNDVAAVSSVSCPHL